MILKFKEDHPTRHNPEKSYKKDQEVVISDVDYGQSLIKEKVAVRIDKRATHKAKVKKINEEV